MEVSWVSYETPQPPGKLDPYTRPIDGLLHSQPTIVWPLPSSVELQCWGPPLGPLVSPTWSRKIPPQISSYLMLVPTTKISPKMNT